MKIQVDELRELRFLAVITATHARFAESTPQAPLASDRRRSPRRPVQYVRVILTGLIAEPHYCIITQVADGGARILTREQLQESIEFTLRFAETEARYRAVWRKEKNSFEKPSETM